MDGLRGIPAYSCRIGDGAWPIEYTEHRATGDARGNDRGGYISSVFSPER